MKVFKNKVGRPSNEALKRRKEAKILIAISIVLVVGILCYGAYSLLNVSGISKNVKSTGAGFTISGKNGGFVYNKKYYSSGKIINLGTTEKYSNISNVFFFASDGKTTFNIKGTFGKKFAKADNFGYPSFVVQSYNSSGKALETKTVQVKSASTYTLTLTASQNIHHIRIGVMKSGKQVYNQTVNIGTTPIIEHSPVSRVIQSSSGEFVVQNPGEIKLKFNISNTNGHTLYYRWFTFNDYTIKSSNVASTNETCVAFSSKTTTKEYPFNINRPRAGMIRVYATLADCKGDTKAKYPQPSSNGKSITNRSVLKEKVVKYRPNNVTTNSEGFTVIRTFDKAKLGKEIGSQNKAGCKKYAYKYSYYMKYGKKTTGYNPICKTYSNLQDLLNLIKNNVNNGNPIMVFFSNSHPPYYQHWGVAVGYKLDDKGNITNLGQVYFLDPYSSAGYQKFGANVLWAGVAFNSNNVSIHSTMKNLKDRTYCYCG